METHEVAPVVQALPFPPLKNDLILRAARGEETERVPIWLMRQAGRYLPEYHDVKGSQSFFDMIKKPDVVAELTLQPIRRFELDAAIIFSDILVIPLALGLKHCNEPGQGVIFDNLIREPEDVLKLNQNVDVYKELGYVFEGLTLTRHQLEGKVPLFGFSGAPWTLMKFMVDGSASTVGISHARKFMVMYPEATERLLKLLTDTIVNYLVAQVKAGAQILQVFDSFAGELGPGLFTKFEVPCLRQIAYQVKQKLAEQELEAVPMVVFAKDAHFGIEELANCGYDVLSIDWTVKPVHARRLAGSQISLQGNLDPCSLYATEDEIKKSVKEMLQKFGTQRYIANLGHGVLRDINPDSVRTFVDAVHKYSEDMIAIS